MQTPIKVLVFLAIWGRPAITELCLMGIDRLRGEEGFKIEALAVISENSMIPLCEKYGVHYVMAENKPVGRKKNIGLQEAKKFDFDYLMELGSDDLVLDMKQYREVLGRA